MSCLLLYFSISEIRKAKNLKAEKLKIGWRGTCGLLRNCHRRTIFVTKPLQCTTSFPAMHPSMNPPLAVNPRTRWY
ncbi:hypothetical protein M413DRAFT_368094 [Hebeloma cylindrosporum]|uniref:Uncharacterized protein n=1 Tax=Hebeloma cylindrosporum TaxID=76867 RepID=A0A0C3CMJ0_HEBCY|nr:hypothetical protein M413DRAFT_368094 [Hebeloma cylindrosporum h7]